MKVRIKGDGFPQSTSITDDETGATIDYVERAEIVLDALTGESHVNLKVMFPKIDLVMNSNYYRPNTRKPTIRKLNIKKRNGLKRRNKNVSNNCM